MAEESAAPFPPALRAGLARRDPVALARFFDAYYERVHAYLQRLVGDLQQAEDLTQEVFLQVHRALPSYDPERDPRPWLFTIATNKLRDHWRSRAAQDGRKEVALEAEDLGEQAAWFEAPAPNVADEEELQREVRAAIAALPEGLRAAVSLRVHEGLSFEDIGRVLGRNEVAARKRYSRGLSALRTRLAGLWKAGERR
jgi:RNA polymerase sigma-70 factor (ECF subfamily)